MAQRIIFLIIGIVLLGGVWWWYEGTYSDLPTEPDIAMAFFDPRQCQTNPWEVDWVQKKGDTPEVRAYLSAHQLEIAQAYYAREAGIEILETRSEVVQERTCEACNCPRGDRIWFSVYPKDLLRLKQFGFEEQFAE